MDERSGRTERRKHYCRPYYGAECVGFYKRRDTHLFQRLRRPLCSLDVSGDGRFDWIDATLIARSLLSFSSDALTTGLFSPPLTQPQVTAIADRISLLVSSGTLDLDGDGQTLASTDGALLTRLAAGQSGATAVNNLLSTVGSRPTWPLIRDYVNSYCGTALQ